MDEKKIALLIDSDNISSKYLDGILDELTQYGVTTYRRIYGDFTSPTKAKWSSQLLKKSIMPIQQFSNTSGKNATDSALIIDAMDLLYRGDVDIFCIVSSDSDFTRLAARLRESGRMIIGMGEKKTPDSFRAACTVFTELENLIENDMISRGMTKEAIQADIISIITKNDNKGKETGSGEIGNDPATGWFVAFSPIESPKYVVAAVIEKGGFGATSAMYAVRDTLGSIYDEPDDVTESIDTAME